MFYFFITDINGNITGCGNSNVPIDPSDPNAIPCTEVQYNNPNYFRIDVTKNPFVVVPLDPTSILGNYKKAQKGIIKKAANVLFNQPVTDAAGRTWNGGKDSGSSIYFKVITSQHNKFPTCKLYDINNDPYTVTIDDGLYIASLISDEYTKILDRKQDLYAAIDAIKDTSEIGINAVKNIVW